MSFKDGNKDEEALQIFMDSWIESTLFLFTSHEVDVSEAVVEDDCSI